MIRDICKELAEVHRYPVDPMSDRPSLQTPVPPVPASPLHTLARREVWWCVIQRGARSAMFCRHRRQDAETFKEPFAPFSFRDQHFPTDSPYQTDGYYVDDPNSRMLSPPARRSPVMSWGNKNFSLKLCRY